MIRSTSTLLSLQVPFLPACPSPHLHCELHEGVDSEEFSSVSSQFDKHMKESTSARFRVFSKLERVVGSGLEQQILRKLITEGTVLPSRAGGKSPLVTHLPISTQPWSQGPLELVTSGASQTVPDGKCIRGLFTSYHRSRDPGHTGEGQLSFLEPWAEGPCLLVLWGLIHSWRVSSLPQWMF